MELIHTERGYQLDIESKDLRERCDEVEKRFLQLTDEEEKDALRIKVWEFRENYKELEERNAEKEEEATINISPASEVREDGDTDFSD